MLVRGPACRAPTPSAGPRTGSPSACAASAGASRSSPTYVHPQIGLVYAAHCVLGLAGSLVAVAIPALGFALVLIAATSMYLDLNTRLYLLRRLFFRRASQNVVSPGNRPGRPRPPGDQRPLRRRAGRRRIRAEPDAALRRARSGCCRSPSPPCRLLFWSLAVLVPILGARMAGLDSNLVSLLQLVPTLVLLGALFAFVDIALSDVVPGANDNASGRRDRALARRGAQARTRPQPRRVGRAHRRRGVPDAGHALVRPRASRAARPRVHLLPQHRLGRPRRGPLRGRRGAGGHLRARLPPDRALRGDRRRRRRGRQPLPRLAASPRLGATDVPPAASPAIPATTITCLEPGALVPADMHTARPTSRGRSTQGAIDRAHGFALDLVRLLDRDVGRRRGDEAARRPPTGAPSEASSSGSPRPRRSSARSMTRYMRWLEAERGLRFDGDYDALWRWSVDELEDFWARSGALRLVHSGDAREVLADRSMPGARWFPGVELNYAEHALPRPRRRRDRRPATGREPRARRDHLGRAPRARRSVRRRAALARVEPRRPGRRLPAELAEPR